MTSQDWQSLLSSNLSQRRAEHLLRLRSPVKGIDATHVEIDGKPYVNFASNNYLGLTHHPRVIAAVREAAAAHGAGSGAAGLITGYTDLHREAEANIAAWKGTEAAVLLPSGYQANHAAVQTIAAVAEAAGKSARFLLDKLSHASLLDAVRATGVDYRVFPHNYLPKLQRLLASADANQIQVVATESIFSMDGDACDLAGLARIKQDHPFLLLLDEAHGGGVYGDGGAGYANHVGLAAIVDVTIATLSKAAGGIGGAVCSSNAFCEALANHGRAYIYSTSVPPSVAAGAIAAIAVMRDEPARQARVRELAKTVRDRLTAVGFRLPPGDSPIVPIIVGEASRAMEAAMRLKSAGLLTVAVRPPTVPPGSSRLRVTLSCDHTDSEIDRLLEVLIACAV